MFMNAINRTTTGLTRSYSVQVSNQTQGFENRNENPRRSFMGATAAIVLSSTVCLAVAAPAASNGLTEVIVLNSALGLNDSPSSSAQIISNESDVSQEAVVDIREIYGRVKVAFGWSVLDTAKLFQVNRKTLYEWLSSDDLPQPRKATLSRALLLDEIASYASSVLTSPIGTDSILPLAGVQITPILESDEISKFQAIAWINELAQKRATGVAKKSLSDRLAAAGMKRRPGSEYADILL
jgi:hypothetical protein